MKKQSHRKGKREGSMAEPSVFVQFLKRVFYVFLFIISVPFVCYFFVFPSIVESDVSDKNIVIVSDKLDVQSNYIYFAHISENIEENNIFSIPSQQEVEVPKGYGSYALQSVFQLLKIDKKDDHFIRATYSELLNTSVDEVIPITEQFTQTNESELSQFFLQNALHNLVTLKWHKVYEPLYLHYKLKNVAVEMLESPGELKKYLEQMYTVSGDTYQYCSVAVINASETNGLARKKANEIENTGALVVRIDDAQEKQEKTTIYYGQEPVDCKILAEKIANIFYKKPEIFEISKLENAQQYRAKVVIIVGE